MAKLGATGDYPMGQLSPDDEGGLRYAVTNDPATGKVLLIFDKPIGWLGLDAADAVRLAKLLKKYANKSGAN